MKIETNDLRIRNITFEDMDFIQKMWGHKESMLATGGIYNITDDMKDDLFQILNKGDDIENHYIIEHKNVSIGDLSIQKFLDHKAQVDFKLFHDEKQKGYGKRVLDMILDYLFNTLNCQEVSIEIWLVESFMFSKLKDYGFEASEEMEDATVLTLTRTKYEEVYHV